MQLFAYAWVLLGPLPVRSMLPYALVCLLYAFVMVMFYMVGSGYLGASAPCVRLHDRAWVPLGTRVTRAVRAAGHHGARAVSLRAVQGGGLLVRASFSILHGARAVTHPPTRPLQALRMHHGSVLPEVVLLLAHTL